MRRAKLLFISTLLLAASCALPGSSVSPFGRTSSVSTRSSYSTTGELLAVNSDSLWIVAQGGVRVIAMSDVDEINVERHPFDAARTFGWTAAAGLGTGIALGIACASYEPPKNESKNCGTIAGPLIVMGVLGTISAISNGHSSDFHLAARDSIRLRAFARFPQGLPSAFRPSGVTATNTP
jgi:hypothetical protein